MADGSAQEWDWIIDALVSIFSSPAWESPLMNFVDQHCLVFDAREEEGELHHTELHLQFTALVENLLETQLAELGISSEDFAAIVMRSGQSSPLFRLLSTHLLALDDFETFRRLMVKRNLELELMAIQAVRGASQKSAPSPSVSSSSPRKYAGAPASFSASSAASDAADAEEEDALKRAIAMSEADAESARQLAEMEAAVLEAAVAESLALEAQQQRLLEREVQISESAASLEVVPAPPASAAAGAASNASRERPQTLAAGDGKRDAEGGGSVVAPSIPVAVAQSPRVPAALSPVVGEPRERGGGGKESEDGDAGTGSAVSRSAASGGSSLRALPPLGGGGATAAAAPVSSRSGAAPSGLPPRDAAPGASFTPGDRDWPGVSAVRALAEASLTGADAEAVRQKKLELVQRKNADRARLLADLLDAEASPGPAPRIPPPSMFQQAVAHARSGGGGGASLAMAEFPVPEPRAAVAPPQSMDEKRRAMRLRLMQQLGEEAREAVRAPAEGKGSE